MYRKEVEDYLGIKIMKDAIHHFNYNGETFIKHLDSIVDNILEVLPPSLENSKLDVITYLESINQFTQLVDLEKMTYEINDRFNTFIDIYLNNYEILTEIIDYDEGRGNFMKLLNDLQVATKVDYENTVSFSAMTKYSCKICKSKNTWGNNNVPDICLNCAGQFVIKMFKNI